MGTKMKGIYKEFKYNLAQIFVVKEEPAEIEIGCPTDVKHVAHIGWDDPSGTAPSWMNEFKMGSNFATASIGNSGSALSPWSSQDFGASMRQQQESETYKGELPNIRKKQKRKKTKSTTSSPKSTSSTSRSARAAAKSKTNFVKGNNTKTSMEVEVA